ncbi:MAG: hypothetical protein ACOYL6_16945 [Bacteriovoracaceae bacterium]
MTQFDFFVGKADYLRAKFLSQVLKPKLFREIYRHCASRLALGFILTLLFYFPLALRRPDILLFSGPLIFGYPHLIASFRYIQQKSSWIFLSLTLICIIGHLTMPLTIPFGVWQIIVASCGFLFVKVIARQYSLKEILPTLILSASLIRLAYWEPIYFIGASLILHNWIGFFYWIESTIKIKEKNRITVSLFCFLLFLIIHILVFQGSFDQYFPSKNTNEAMTTGWYLASWTNDPIIWYRMLVLYAFGLSMHYFVWLKAIPESLNKIEHPNNFRLNLKYLKKDLGRTLWIILLLLSVIGVLIWFFSFDLGSKIYFECAILHGTLEIVFLVSRLINFLYPQTTFSVSLPYDKKMA